MAKTDEERYKDIIVAGLEILSLRKEIEDRIETIKSNITVTEYEKLDFERGALDRVAQNAIDIANNYHVIMPRWFIEDGYCRNPGMLYNSITASPYDSSKFYSFIFMKNLLKDVFGRE